MTDDINEYWRRFETLQDKLWRDPDNTSNIQTVLHRLSELIDDATQCRTFAPQDEVQLRHWISTFYDLCGQLNVDLGLLSDAINAFQRSIAIEAHLETRVRLIQALSQHGQIAETCSEISRVSSERDAFTSSRDSESAAKLLTVICSNPEIAKNVDTIALRDVLQAIAARGIAKISLMSLENDGVR